MDATNKLRKQNKTQLKKNEDALVALQKVPQKNELEISECEKKVEKISKQKVDLEEELQKNYASFEKQTDPLREQREQLETQLIDLKKNVNDAKSNLAVLESELKIIKHGETTEIRKYESLHTAYEESKKDLSEKKKKVADMQNALPTVISDIALKKGQLQKLQQEEKVMFEKLRTLKAEVTMILISIYCFFLFQIFASRLTQKQIVFKLIDQTTKCLTS